MPNRILKENICTSDSIDGLSWFEEVLFYRLIVNCDDYGRFDGRIPVIRSRLFPLKDNLTNKSVSEAINRLVSAGLVSLYVFEGKPFLNLPTWNDHQSVRAKKSRYPAPEDSMKSSEIICKQMISDAPVIQSNPNQDPIRESESNSSVSAHACGTAADDADSSAPDGQIPDVLRTYCAKIAPSPSEKAVADLKAFSDMLSPEVVLWAIDTTAETEGIRNKTRYLFSILREKQKNGVKCLADLGRKEVNGNGTSRSSESPFARFTGNVL